MQTAERERMWRAIGTANPGWDANDLARIAGVALDEAQAYCAWLASAGYIRPHGQGCYRATQAARQALAAPSPDGQERMTLDLVLDTSSHDVRLLRESTPGAWQRVQKALVQPGSLRDIESGTARDRIWLAVRDMRRFTRRALIEATGCAKGAVADYVRLLCLAGYVAEAGQDGVLTIYELTNDPGPQRPVIRETIRRNRRKS